MRFSKRSRTLNIAGRRTGKSYVDTAEVAVEERHALLGGSPPPFVNGMAEPGEEPPLQGDPTQYMLTALGRYQKSLAKADAGVPQTEWADECMSQLIAGIEIAISQDWDDIREALTDTARVLHTYEEADRAIECSRFLQDSYETLCLMVGDLIVGSAHNGVMQKWHGTYSKIVQQLERAGLTLTEDEEDDEPAATARDADSVEEEMEEEEGMGMEPMPDENAFSARANAFFEEDEDEEITSFDPEGSASRARENVGEDSFEEADDGEALRLVDEDAPVPCMPEDEVAVFEEDEEELVEEAHSEPPDSRIPFDMPPVPDDAFGADAGNSFNDSSACRRNGARDGRDDDEDRIIPFELPIGNAGAALAALPALDVVLPEESGGEALGAVSDADEGGAQFDAIPMPEEELNIVTPLGADVRLANPETDEFATRVMEQNGFDIAAAQTYTGGREEAVFLPDEPVEDNEEAVFGQIQEGGAEQEPDAAQFDLPFETDGNAAMEAPIEEDEYSPEAPAESALREEPVSEPIPAMPAVETVRHGAPVSSTETDDALEALLRAAREAMSGGSVGDAKLVALQLAVNIAQLEVEQGQTSLLEIERNRQECARGLDEAERMLRETGQALDAKEMEFAEKENACRSTRETLVELRTKEAAEARAIEELEERIREAIALRDEHARVKMELDATIEISSGEESRLLADLEGLTENIEETRETLNQAQDDAARFRAGLEEYTAAAANAESDLARRRESASGIGQIARAIGGSSGN